MNIPLKDLYEYIDLMEESLNHHINRATKDQNTYKAMEWYHRGQVLAYEVSKILTVDSFRNYLKHYKEET